MSKQDLLKGFIISYNLTNEAKNAVHSVFVVAYSKKEAGNIFAKWAQGKNVYEQIIGIVVKGTRKNKRNQYMFTKEFYERQNIAVDNLYKKGTN